MECYIHMWDHITTYFFRITQFASELTFYNGKDRSTRVCLPAISFAQLGQDGVCPYKVEPWSGVLCRWHVSSRLSTLYSSSACDGLTLVAESTHVPLGGTIVITCKTVISYDNLMTLKKVYPEDLMRPYVDIADNQFLNAPFKDLERYSMTYIPEADSMFEFILTITGTWPCFFFAYPFPDVVALVDLLYISRSSDVRPTLRTLAQSFTSFSQDLFGLPPFLWPFTFPSSIQFSYIQIFVRFG